MSAEDYALHPADLMNAMKLAAEDDTDLLDFLQHVYIMPGGLYPGPWNAYTLYIFCVGSPETEISEDGIVYAEHHIVMDAVIPVVEPNEASIVGGADTIGITNFVSRVLQFFNGNLLGLEDSGLEPGVPPTCYAPANAYEPIPGGDGQETLLITGRMLYRARTRPFKRA